MSAEVRLVHVIRDGRGRLRSFGGADREGRALRFRQRVGLGAADAVDVVGAVMAVQCWRFLLWFLAVVVVDAERPLLGLRTVGVEERLVCRAVVAVVDHGTVLHRGERRRAHVARFRSMRRGLRRLHQACVFVGRTARHVQVEVVGRVCGIGATLGVIRCRLVICYRRRLCAFCRRDPCISFGARLGLRLRLGRLKTDESLVDPLRSKGNELTNDPSEWRRV